MSVPDLQQRLRSRGSPRLAHWSEVELDPRQLSQRVVPILRDLIGWASDIAVSITHNNPEDREAVERCRYAALAWLDGERTSEIATNDILTTVAAILSNVERNIGLANAPHIHIEISNTEPRKARPRNRRSKGGAS